MSKGLPDHPPEHLADQFVESKDDATCPVCGWDIDDAIQDPSASHDKGVLMAIEVADGSVFSTMGGAENECWYFRCPGSHIQVEAEPDTPLDDPGSTDDEAIAVESKACLTFFTVEMESLLGGMA